MIATLTKMFRVIVSRWVGQNNHCGCGHTSKYMERMVVHGQTGIVNLADYHYEWCTNCLQKSVIQCANCEKLIFPNDAIGLAIITDRTAIPPHAISFLNEDYVQLICCHRPSCTFDITDQVARWVMPGKVKQIKLRMDRLLANNDRDNEDF